MSEGKKSSNRLTIIICVGGMEGQGQGDRKGRILDKIR